MSAYVIVNVDTAHPEEYEGYKEMAQKTVAKYGGRYLARGGKMQIVEGDWKPTRIVILEFESFDRAVEWWESEEYAPAKTLRRELSKADIIILDGHSG